MCHKDDLIKAVGSNPTRPLSKTIKKINYAKPEAILPAFVFLGFPILAYCSIFKKCCYYKMTWLIRKNREKPLISNTEFSNLETTFLKTSFLNLTLNRLGTDRVT